jgi:glycosyltransferase involved in cell wall biosynthesis
VVYIGVDHHHAREPVEPERPATELDLEANGFILCLGVDFMHKNRLFALRVVEQLQARHGWKGRLVLAGPQASPGSSAAADRAYLDGHPAVAAATVRLGAVSEPHKRWLVANAALVISPTTYEGFGLVPFEAADVGTPCLFAPQASLAEVLPAESALIEPWDPAATADRAMRVMREPAERERLLESVRQAGLRYRWDRTGRELVAVYQEAADCPARDLGLEAFSDSDHPLAGSRLEEPLLELVKVVRFWRAYGFFRGTWLGSRGLARRVRRRRRGRDRRQPEGR